MTGHFPRGASPGPAVSIQPVCWLLLVVALNLFLTGCARTPLLGQVMTPSYEPSNVYREDAVIPPHIRRVAVLPMTTLDEDNAELGFGRDTLAPVLISELNRARRFELVILSAEDLRLISGRGAWNAEEKLPLEFFERIREKTGADAVMFSRLTLYRAYEPLAIGWRVKLIDADEPHILWAVDEVFDARDPSVAAAAVRYAQDSPDTPPSLADSRSVLLSVRRFGHYAAHAVVRTMPGRAVARR